MSTREEDQPEQSVIGQPLERVDGQLNVTGQAQMRQMAATPHKAGFSH